MNLLKSCLAQELDGFGAAPSHLAVGHDLAAGIEFVNPLGQLVERDEMTPEVGDLILVRLAHVQDK